MKIALLIAGYLRCLYENINNIKNNIIQNNDCDIYIHITNDYNADKKYFNKKISLDFIQKELTPKVFLISNNINFDNKNNDILNQNYKFYWLNKEKNKIMKLEKFQYDIVFKIRPDVNILNKIDFNKIEINKIYIPNDSKIDKKKLKKNDDKYICDIIAYGDSNTMNLYFDYYLYLDNLINKYDTNINETLLYNYLKDQCIEYEVVNIDYIVILSLCNTIAITGDSGSGKTTLSNIIKEIFNSSFILECDRYHKWERNNIQWKYYTHLNPNANYITKMQNDVFDLKIGKNIYQVDYDHNSGKFTDNKIIESKENIIVCGLHSLYLPNEIINLKIFMDTDDNLRTFLKIKRDIQNRGYSIDKILKQIKDRENDFKEYIYPQKKNADIVIKLFTDKVFDFNNFNINETFEIKFKIGFKNTYCIDNIISKLDISKISYDDCDKFIYLYFDNIKYYSDIIKIIILNY